MENEYLKPYFDNTERLENLSYAIGYYRKEKGLSQEQLAEKLGISRGRAVFEIYASHEQREGPPAKDPRADPLHRGAIYF